MEINDEKIQSLEKEMKFEIIRLEEEADGKNHKFIEQAKQSIQNKFEDLKAWMKDEHTQEEIKARMQSVKNESLTLMYKAKEELHKFYNRDDVQQGKQKIQDGGVKLSQCIQDGVDKAMEHERVAKVVNTVADKVESIHQDERVQKTIKSLKKTTLKAAEQAYMGLKRVLDTEDEDDKKG